MTSIIANPKTKAELQATLDFLQSMKINVEVYEKPAKAKILKSIEQGFKEAKMYEQGKIKLQDAFEVYNEL